jgi:phytoene desaturase
VAKVVVVGAGVGGLAAAARLAHLGHEVTVVERRSVVGGRNSRLRVGEADFDCGPTLLMMREPFERLFSDLGERIEDWLDLRQCDPVYRAWFGDGTVLDATTDLARMVPRLASLVGRDEAERFPKFLGDAGELYRVAVPQFVRRNYRSAFDLARARDLAAVVRHRLLASYSRRVKSYASDERLRQLISFQTMYLGLSPHAAPWVYAVLAYMELGEGVWYPFGGMARVSEAVAELAERRGARILVGREVVRIEGGAARLADGETIAGDAVLCNADFPWAEQNLLGRPPKPRRYSCSALVTLMDYDGELPELRHHNVFFGSDFDGHLEALYGRRPLPESPAFYACASSKTEPSRARPGGTNLSVLVPVPNCADGPGGADGMTMAAVESALAKASGFDKSLVRATKTLDAAEWRDEFRLDRGAAFGLSHDFWQSVAFRPSNRDRRNPRLFYVGASTNPGNGVPMVLVSAELAVARMAESGVLD